MAALKFRTRTQRPCRKGRFVMEKTKTQREKRSSARKQHILQCAQKLFDEFGYDNVTIREIASESHSSIGSIYHFFRDKSELLMESIMRVDDLYNKAYSDIKQTPQFQELPALERLKIFFVRVQIICVEQGDQLLRKTYLGGLKYPKWRILKTGPERTVYKIVMEMLARCRTEGSITSTLSDGEIFEQFVVVSRGLFVEWLIRLGDFDMKAMSEQSFEIMLNGLP
jgi:AcrR family transcriptional regulator